MVKINAWPCYVKFSIERIHSLKGLFVVDVQFFFLILPLQIICWTTLYRVKNVSWDNSYSSTFTCSFNWEFIIHVPSLSSHTHTFLHSGWHDYLFCTISIIRRNSVIPRDIAITKAISRETRPYIEHSFIRRVDLQQWYFPISMMVFMYRKDKRLIDGMDCSL